MNRTIALAYAITGLAVAAALVAVIASTTGLFASGAAPVAAAPHVEVGSDHTLPQVRDGSAPLASLDPGATAGFVDSTGAEIVYVDAPPEDRGGDDHHHGKRAKHDRKHHDRKHHDRKHHDRKHHDKDDDDD